MVTAKQISPEIKVGVTVGIAILLLAVTIFTVKKFSFGNSGYPITVNFGFVDALNTQADVVIGGGVKIGHVTEIQSENEKILLKVRINRGIRIPRTAKFQILSKGLMGDKYLNVVAGEDSGEYLKPGDMVDGIEPINMDKIFQRFAQVADSIKVLLGDEDIRTSVSETLKNLSRFSGRLDRLVKNNDENITSGIKGFSDTAQAITHLAQNVDAITLSLQQVLSAANRENFEKTLLNLKRATDQLNEQVNKLDTGKGTLAVLLNDPQMAQDLKLLVNDVKKNPWKLLWKQ